MPLLFLLISLSNFFFSFLFDTLLGFIFFSAILPDRILSLLQDFIWLNCRIPFSPILYTFLQLLCPLVLSPSATRQELSSLYLWFQHTRWGAGVCRPHHPQMGGQGDNFQLADEDRYNSSSSQAGFGFPLQCSVCKHNPSLCSFPFIIKVEEEIIFCMRYSQTKKITVN